MEISNFKKLQDLTFALSEGETSIKGKNGLGKSSIFDAFLWVLFGKNSSEETRFSVWPLDEQNNQIDVPEVSVCIRLEVDGVAKLFRKTLKRKFKNVKSGNPKFDGFETLHFLDGHSVKASDFQEVVSGIVSEDIFRLITNPKTFNSLPWEKRRETLVELAGEVTDQEVYAKAWTEQNEIHVFDLMNQLKTGKTLSTIKKEVVSEKELIKGSLDSIPARKQEVQRSIAEYENTDFVKVGVAAADAKAQLDEFDEKIRLQTEKYNSEFKESVDTKNAAIKAAKIRQNEIGLAHDQKAKKEVQDLHSEITSIKQTVGEKGRERATLTTEFISLEKSVQRLAEERDQYRKDWYEMNDSIMPESHFERCEDCKREFSEADRAALIQQAKANFISKKAASLQAISVMGKRVAAQLVEAEESLASVQEKCTKLTKEIDELHTALAEKANQYTILNSDLPVTIQNALDQDKEFKDLDDQIRMLTEELNQLPLLDIKGLEEARQGAFLTFSAAQKLLEGQDLQQKGLKRLEDLEAESVKLQHQLTEKEELEAVIMEWTKAKINLVEERISGLFRMVQFKMFQENINGTVTACCETLLNGVPWKDINTAGQVQAGLDIIMTLSEFYKVKAPIFIDYRESVETIPDMATQIINLIHSPKDKKLKIS